MHKTVLAAVAVGWWEAVMSGRRERRVEKRPRQCDELRQRSVAERGKREADEPCCVF